MKVKKLNNNKIFKSRILDGDIIEIVQHPTPKRDAFGKTFSGLLRFKSDNIYDLKEVIDNTIKNI
jgi:hypothetical protein